MRIFNQKSIYVLKNYFHDIPYVWNRIVAFVIMFGIGFDHNNVFSYDREKVKKILEEIKKENLYVEAHSIDYQTKEALREMVEDGVKILKVGPALTSAFRRAIFLLSMIENELVDEEKRSNIKKVILEVMLKDDKYWRNYYEIDEAKFDIWYNLLDRVRYYWEYKPIKKSWNKFFDNFSEGIVLKFIYQYFYDSYFLIRERKLENTPFSLVKNEIKKS